MRRYCLALGLRKDPELVREYVRLHAAVWPEVKDSLHDAGVVEMEIYLLGEQLFMIMDVAESFSFEQKAAMDRANPKVMEWERLMGQFQQVEDGADPVSRWQVMRKVFDLNGAMEAGQTEV